MPTIPPGFPDRDSSPTAQTRRVAAFFDLDKTIIATSSTAAFTKPFYAGGLISRGAVLRSAYAHFLYLVGSANADQTERMRAHLSALVTGWPVEQVSAIVTETLHEFIDPYVYAEAVELIAEHHAAGQDVVIVSASGSELVKPIAAMLGADHAIATQLEVVDGKYTGQLDFYAYGQHKADAIAVLAAERGYDLDRCYAFSDSITDAPMLELVGHGYAVNPDRALRRLAAERGWGVLTFSRPVALRRELSPRSWSLLVFATCAAVAIAVRYWWLGRRRG